MYIIKIHNDGKEKHQSFEASVFNVEENNTEIIGYGESLVEALYEMKLKLNSKILELQNINYDNFIYVDCVGKEIKP